MQMQMQCLSHITLCHEDGVHILMVHLVPLVYPHPPELPRLVPNALPEKMAGRRRLEVVLGHGGKYIIYTFELHSILSAVRLSRRTVVVVVAVVVRGRAWRRARCQERH